MGRCNLDPIVAARDARIYWLQRVASPWLQLYNPMAAATCSLWLQVHHRRAAERVGGGGARRAAAELRVDRRLHARDLRRVSTP